MFEWYSNLMAYYFLIKIEITHLITVMGRNILDSISDP